ncbi:MAG TPA: translocation/assembly module TamB domain-containing protein, partial [Kofleriaceae bacterium]|nr:translocation/assembly module TamB domain-containing protein [Kofleriaceae bacterium]
YSWLFRSIELDDIEIRDRDDKPAIAIKSIAIDLDSGSLLHGKPVLDDLAIGGASATIIQNADGTTNLTGLVKPNHDEPLASIEIGKLAVRAAVHVVKADGTTLDVTDLVIDGSVAAKPVDGEAEVSLGKLTAAVSIVRPGAAAKRFDLAIDKTSLGRHGDTVDVDIEALSFGALSIGAIKGHLAVAAGKLAGEQSVVIDKLRLDHQKLSSMLGKKIFVDDVVVDATVSGPPDKLAVHGVVVARRTKLALDGTVDATVPARPRYDASLVGKGESEDLISGDTVDAPAIQTDVTMHVVGSGIAPPDLDAVVTLGVGPTHIGSIGIGGLTATAHARRGGIELDQLEARGLGFTIRASGKLDADTHLHGRIAVSGSPAEAIHVLREAGIATPIKIPPLHDLDVAVGADGFVDGELALTIEPARVAVAGGNVSIDGTAKLDHRKLVSASTTIAARGIDIDALAALAGKTSKVHGSLSATLGLTRTPTDQHGDGELTIALREPAITISGHTHADMSTATIRANLVHAGAPLGTLTATVGHDTRTLAPDAPWHVVVDLPRHALAELAALAPHPPALPDGDLAMHVDIAGTPRAPRGTIDATVGVAADASFGAKHASFHGAIAPSTTGIAITAKSSADIDGLAGPVANIVAAVSLPSPFVGATPDFARVRAGTTITATIDAPERELASIPRAPADLGGTVSAHLEASGPPTAIQLAGKLAWRGYRTAAGTTGETTVTLAGTPAHLDAHVDHDGVTITAAIARSDNRVDVQAHIAAADLAILPLLPEKLAAHLGDSQLGTLRWNMDAVVGLVRGPDGLVIEPPKLTGTLAIAGGAFALPNTTRRWHDIDLELAGDPRGIRLARLELHESDAHDPDRTLSAHGLVIVDHLHPQRAELDVSVHDWLLLGKTSPLFGDAPTAQIDLDAGVTADLTQPILAIDATLTRLAFSNPDRQERGHQPELSEVSSDVIYVDAATPTGKLPVPPPPAAPHPRTPIDVRIHVPTPIHVTRPPFDAMAHGELALHVRDDGLAIRGAMQMDSGTLFLFGRVHKIVDGSLSFTDDHPKGWFHVVAERQLPPEDVRTTTIATQRLTVTGAPSAPAVAISGAAGDTIPEVLSMYTTGHSMYTTRPGLPASSTVEMPRDDQFLILGFVSLALPHLLFLDSIAAWADPTEPRGAYGRIRDLQAERYTNDRSARFRAVGRPTQPGRSTAELQWDHLWLDSGNACFGAGVRAGDRLGGGLGMFFEWSSGK